jgi:outer membrane biosynthesis protein TonB
MINEYITKFTDQATSLTNNTDAINSEVHKVVVESIQNCTKKSIDAVNSACVKANQNLTDFTKITSINEFSQFINNYAQTTKDDAADFAKQTANSISEFTAKYTSAFEQDIKTAQDKVNTAFKQTAPKVEAPKVEAPKVEAPKVETPKAQAPKAQAPKVEAPKVETPKAQAPKAQAPKAQAPKAQAPKAQAPKAQAPKVEIPNTQINK